MDMVQIKNQSSKASHHQSQLESQAGALRRKEV